MKVADIADEIAFIDRAAEFTGTGTVALGQDFPPEHRAMFGRVARTQTVRQFRLSDVVLDAPFAALFKGNQVLDDTTYLTFGAERDDIRLSLASLEWIGSGTPLAIGFNRGWRNFYHWTIQCLPAIDTAIRLARAEGLKLLLPPLEPSHEASLRMLGHAEHPRVTIEQNRHFHLSRAIYSEFLNETIPFHICPSARLTYARLREATPFVPRANRFIYVSRSDSHNRRIRNEDELASALQRHGFEICVLSAHSLAEQINIFRNARVIVAPHGAGLANLVHCSPGTIVHELLPHFYVNPCFNRLAQAHDLHYLADVFGGRYDGDVHTSSYDVVVETVRSRFGEIEKLLA